MARNYSLCAVVVTQDHCWIGETSLPARRAGGRKCVRRISTGAEAVSGGAVVGAGVGATARADDLYWDANGTGTTPRVGNWLDATLAPGLQHRNAPPELADGNNAILAAVSERYVSGPVSLTGILQPVHSSYTLGGRAPSRWPRRRHHVQRTHRRAERERAYQRVISSSQREDHGARVVLATAATTLRAASQ